MASDDHSDDQIPDADAPPSDLELEQASSFGDLIDGMLDGGTLPPAMPADDRTLLEVASVVRVVAGDSERVDLASERRDALIDAALRKAVAAPPAATLDAAATATNDDDDDDDDEHKVVSLASRRVRRSAPWLLTAVAAAAAVFFALRPAPRQAPPQTAATQLTTPERLSTDVLVGRIHKTKSGDASSRIDLIYTDRMSLYRNARLRGRR